MSGICGIFNLDGAPVAEKDLGTMTTLLERRGPDGTGRWRDRSVGIGQTLLATTPEQDSQPYRHAETGCVITADVRLDYRGDLIDALDFHARREPIADAELLLCAYLRWGEHCLDRLCGDFAFAIFDPRSNAVFCARDHSGMRLLYYFHDPRKRFVFASDARVVAAAPGVPYRLNEGRIADFLVQELEWIDYDSTFFERVYRLPPGHCLTVAGDRFELREYWRPAPGPDPGLKSDDEWREGFLDVFTAAVRERLRAGPDVTAATLSGGMDSGSVVVVAKDLLAARGERSLSTYSGFLDLDDSETDSAESRAITAATAMPSISPTLVRPVSKNKPAETLLGGNAEPFDGQMSLLRSVYGAARADGRRVVLDGGGGDVLLSEGSYVVRLLRRGRIATAISETADLARFYQTGTALSDIGRCIRAAFVPERLKLPFRKIRRRRHVDAVIAGSPISREFADSVDLAGRFERQDETFASCRARDYAVECCNAIRPNVTAGRERYARVAAANEVEACDPFLDRRVIEFSAWLPGRLRLHGGRPKAILRDLMANRLPTAALLAPGKAHVGWRFNLAVAAAAKERGELTLAALPGHLRGYVDAGKIEAAWRVFEAGGDFEPVHAVGLISAWLRENVKKPLVSD